MAKQLYVICGLPKSTSSAVCQELARRLPKFDFIQFVSALTAPKYTDGYLENVLSSLAKHILKKRKDLPSTLSVIVADDISIERISNAFFPFARLFKCELEDAYNIDSNVRQFLSIIEENPIQNLKEFLFLPPGNYQVAARNTIEIFRGFYRGIYTVDELEKFFPTKKFNKSNLSKVLKGKMHHDFFIDDRKLVFPPCKPTESHAEAHEEDLQKYGPRYFLSSLYRFGIHKKTGFHHDVQFAFGKKLHSGVVFFCGKKNERTECAGQTHANIYMNDYVRFPPD